MRMSELLASLEGTAYSARVAMSTLIGCLPKVVSKKYQELIPLNVRALREGESFARDHA